MIIPDKKKLPMVILKKMSEGKEESMPVAPESDLRGEEALDMIVDDLMMGIKEGSRMKVKDAMRAFVSEIQLMDEAQDSEME